MPDRVVSTVIIGLLAATSVLFTHFLVQVPIWVVFIAWASFFAAGGGVVGARSTLLMGIAGVLSGTGTLVAATALGGSVWAVAACCIVGAGLLVAIGAFPLFAFTPAGFLGFASTAGTMEATGHPLTSAPTFAHPSVLVIVAFVVGIGFGVASQWLPNRASRLVSAPQPPVQAG